MKMVTESERLLLLTTRRKEVSDQIMLCKAEHFAMIKELSETLERIDTEIRVIRRRQRDEPHPEELKDAT